MWGWDATPGIVSVWVERDGLATVWRRDVSTGALTREVKAFRPWILLRTIADLSRGGAEFAINGAEPRSAERRAVESRIEVRELSGEGELRFLVSAPTLAELTEPLLRGASARLKRDVRHPRDLGDDEILMLSAEEQYLVASGRTYFKGLSFDHLHRMQFDLETTGLDAERNRIFMIAVRHPNGELQTLEANDDSDNAERRLLAELAETVRAVDPDVIENHNLHGFDLPFLYTRAKKLRTPFALGRTNHKTLLTRGSRRGSPSEWDADRRVRYVAPGRELIDTLDAVRRYDFSARDLPSHGLKAVAKHLGFAGPAREYIRGDQIYATFRTDPDRVRRYATDDVLEVATLARMLGGAAFALARMAPRRYERLADAGAATGVVDPLLVRAYLRSGVALPVHQEGDGTTHTGAALYLFATGVASRVVKADVASLYPSLMRQFQIGPARDSLGAMLALVDQLVVQRLEAKANSKLAPANSAERYTLEATSAAMKLVVNSAYGYLGAGGGLTRFADVHAANEVTRRGRETLALMSRELAARGVTLLEGDTDGVYFAVPSGWSEADERRVVAEVGALLPPLVQLDFEGRYSAMLSHEPKNYALLTHSGELILRGVAFRSSRAEPFGDRFLRTAIRKLLEGDVAAVRDEYVRTISLLRTRSLPTYDVSSRVRLTKNAEQYERVRKLRRELPYEAMIASGRTTWRVGERARVYRTQGGGAGLVVEAEEGGRGMSVAEGGTDPRDYDVEFYVRLLRESFASRMVRAFTTEDFESLFADPVQPSLFSDTHTNIVAVLEKFDEVPL